MSVKSFPKHFTEPEIDDRVKCNAEHEQTELYPIFRIVNAWVLTMVYEFQKTFIDIQMKNTVNCDEYNKY